ncbi:hypothetical protein GII30_15085 [Gordonia amarae]|uniref:Uncharacterized protein n=2 Tax=Gordonia amarae TaxID=36821 RepID=G7GJU9_9ACTN|nr:hypothetical protein [Gordonia amarae]MCS3879729.1 hypothetical protein [Gordonia amarae]QHN18167.1 hypothetical protein GII35_15400 [Gordonia amarae]QHN31554.1 hypothetical protein GII32_15250 [Gordonia amarae]QHN40298.1 hypothetical protein GII30_15085 [Gordonia amarae]GAB03874.1 hypothetical protein GOAMR_06_00800 [Gordonia amarae NBRC 15530]
MAEGQGQRSAASMNYAEVCSEGAASDSAARANISWEAQRKTAGPKAIAQYAAGNPAINTAMTKHNIDRVNDGAGGWRETRSIAEVVKYGDDRVARMSAAPKDGNRVALTTVGQLPWAYCEPDGTEYQAVDGNGTPKVYTEGPRAGQPVMLPRYKIREDRREEAMRYFRDWLDFQAEVLPGGHDAMHGYSINLDESRPHIQLLSDPFEPYPSKKNPDALKSGYSRAFGRHPKDPMVPQLDKSGQPVMGDDGKPKMVKDGPSAKMTRNQAGLRAYMVARGYEVDPERDEARHDRHLGLADYKDLQHAKTEVQYAMADVGAVMGEAEAMRDESVEASIRAAEAEGDLVAAHETATESGYVEGLTRGEAAVATRTAALDQREAGIDAEVARLALITEEAKGEAMVVMQEAHAEAGGITATAHAAAQTIVADADIAAERIRSQARIDGYAAGHAEGVTAGAEAWEREHGHAYRTTVRTEVEAGFADRERQLELNEAAVRRGQEANGKTDDELERKRQEVETRWAEVNAFDRDAAERGMNRWILGAMKADERTFAPHTALQHFADIGQSNYQRQHALGRAGPKNFRQTEGERREAALKKTAAAQEKNADAAKIAGQQDHDQSYGQD